MSNNHLAVMLECHSAEAPWVGNVKNVTKASLYVIEGIHADLINGFHDVQEANGDSVCIASEMSIEQAELMQKQLVELFQKNGLEVSSNIFYDE
jgi:hypothetical protein